MKLKKIDFIEEISKKIKAYEVFWKAIEYSIYEKISFKIKYKVFGKKKN